MQPDIITIRNLVKLKFGSIIHLMHGMTCNFDFGMIEHCNGRMNSTQQHFSVALSRLIDFFMYAEIISGHPQGFS